MVREIKFKQGVISGDDMREVISIFPELEDRFEQRKSFDEYYFNGGVEVEIRMDQLDVLSREFVIEIDFSSIKI